MNGVLSMWEDDENYQWCPECEGTEGWMYPSWKDDSGDLEEWFVCPTCDGMGRVALDSSQSKSAMHSGGSGAPERQGIDVPVSANIRMSRSTRIGAWALTTRCSKAGWLALVFTSVTQANPEISMSEPTFTETFGCTPVAGDPVCRGCGNVIDPDCCGCGDSREGHDSMWSGHSFVPMGCDCMRAAANPEAK